METDSRTFRYHYSVFSWAQAAVKGVHYETGIGSHRRNFNNQPAVEIFQPQMKNPNRIIAGTSRIECSSQHHGIKGRHVHSTIIKLLCTILSLHFCPVPQTVLALLRSVCCLSANILIKLTIC